MFKTGLLIATLLLAHPAYGEEVGSLQDEMQRLEQSRNSAIRSGDFATLEQLYAKEFAGVNAAGRVVGRDELFGIFRRAAGNFGAVDSRVTSARTDGNYAFVIGRISIAGASGGSASTSIFLHIFRRTPTGWTMVSGSSTPMPTPAG